MAFKLLCANATHLRLLDDRPPMVFVLFSKQHDVGVVATLQQRTKKVFYYNILQHYKNTYSISSMMMMIINNNDDN